MVDASVGGGGQIKMLKAYTMSGDYIGNQRTADYLCKELDILPELGTPESKVCSIGFCEKEQKWYGWYHGEINGFSIKGFGIGSSAKRAVTADIAAEPPDDEDASTHASNHKHTRKHKQSSYPAETVQEEWTARTLDDARRMAIDFADSVS